ncbi:hypothetical protein HBB16_20970 [Pseudonocardia sp. MCCB 268]|nr:hypothetical protein [Pseudonocardia cytotoxica]
MPQRAIAPLLAGAAVIVAVMFTVPFPWHHDRRRRLPAADALTRPTATAGCPSTLRPDVPVRQRRAVARAARLARRLACACRCAGGSLTGRGDGLRRAPPAGLEGAARRRTTNPRHAPPLRPARGSHPARQWLPLACAAADPALHQLVSPGRSPNPGTFARSGSERGWVP